MIQLIDQADFQTSLWKNGLGITRQIDIYPEHSCIQKNDFIWRLSQAEVQSTNTFSLFPECERKLTVLSGQGLILNNFSLIPNQVHTFSGEESILCSLIDDQQVIDLGLIYKKNMVKADFKIIEIKNSLDLNLVGKTHFLYLLDGVSILFQQIELKSGNIIKIENETEIQIRNKSDDPIKLIHIELNY